MADGLRILRDVADAITYAHQHRIVHRDIKPENILLSGRHALVADFGIAKAVSDAGAGEPALTTAGFALGTPAYMAPEQAAADPATDHRADIYALGVVAYELFAGAPPFAASTHRELMAAHLTRAAEPLSKLRPDIPGALEQLVMRCLEKNPADRWQRSEELLRRIEGLLAADLDSLPPAIRPAQPVDCTFRLTEDVCRKLNRATLDPRIIGENLHYLDNQVESPVLLCLLHGFGLSQEQFTRHLELLPYRAIAPTLYGLEASNPRRIAVALDDHLTILGELLDDVVRRLRPETVIVAGFSSGGDFGFQLLEKLGDASRPRVDGFVSLGCNISIETCFVSGLFARMTADRPDDSFEAFRKLGVSARNLEEWLNQQEYLIRILRKFRTDVEPLRQLGRDVVRFFLPGEENPFPRWYREASHRTRVLRCVFEDSDDYLRPLSEIRLRNLDQGILGPRYREDSIVVEQSDHFGLVRPEVVARHVEEVLALIRGQDRGYAPPAG
jgi:pimeloyl-ACP methyl ester carboxylesterase